MKEIEIICNNELDFLKVQLKLIDQGYSWYGGDKVIYGNELTYPQYIQAWADCSITLSGRKFFKDHTDISANDFLTSLKIPTS